MLLSLSLGAVPTRLLPMCECSIVIVFTAVEEQPEVHVSSLLQVCVCARPVEHVRRSLPRVGRRSRTSPQLRLRVCARHERRQARHGLPAAGYPSTHRCSYLAVLGTDCIGPPDSHDHCRRVSNATGALWLLQVSVGSSSFRASSSHFTSRCRSSFAHCPARRSRRQCGRV